MNRLTLIAEALFVIGVVAGVFLLLVVALGAAFILASIDEHSEALLVNVH